MNKAKPANTIFDRVVNQLTTAAHQASNAAKEAAQHQHAHPAEAAHADPSRLDRFMQLSGLTNIAKDKLPGIPGLGPDDSPELLYSEGDGALDVGVAEKMLEWHAEAVGRMVELSALGDVPKNAFSLLKVSADSFGKAYVETALDTALHQISLYDAKSEPDLAPLSVIRTADMIMQLWQRYIATALVPLAGSSVTVRREMGIFNNHVVVRIEGKVNDIVQRSTDGKLRGFGSGRGNHSRGCAADGFLSFAFHSHHRVARLAPRQAKEARLQAQERRPRVCPAEHGALLARVRVPGQGARHS